MANDAMLGARGRARRKLLIGAAAALAFPVARAQSTRTVIDHAGRRVDVPIRVRRVFAAGPPASVLIFALAPDALLGWTTSFRPDERPYVAERYANLPTLGRLTGRGNTANVEVVLAAKPDLIFDYGAVTPTVTSLADRVQAQIGIPYLLLDGAFDRVPDAFTLLGELLGEPAHAAEWARYAAATVADIRTRVERVPAPQRPRVYYGRGPTGLVTGLAGSINAESFERVGAVNVAAALGHGGLAQVSIEQVLAWAPETVVTLDPNFYASIWRDPLWQAVPAVRTGRVFLAPNVPFGWIDSPPSINRLIGLRWLAKVLYPEVFPEDLRAIVSDFYTRAYHQTPSAAQLDALLATALPRAKNR